MSFSTTLPILSRADGTFVVQYAGSPYHVVSKSIDPSNLFDLAEVSAFALANPSLVSPDTSQYTPDQKALAGIMSLSDYQSYAYAQIDSKVKLLLNAGFTFESQQVYCDQQSQANLTSEVTAMVAGIVAYPVIWDLGDGDSLSIPDQATLMNFAMAMKSFIQTTYANGITTKAAVKAATTLQAVQSAYQTFVGGVG